MLFRATSPVLLDRGGLSVDWSNPLTKGLSLLYAPGHSNKPIHLGRGAIATTQYQGSAAPRYGHGGLGMGGPSGAYLGGNSASNTYTLNQNEGTVLGYLLADFSPTDGVSHFAFRIGAASYPGGPTLDFQKYSSNNWSFGWYSGSDTRASVAASGTFSQGQPFTAGGTWNKTTGLVGTTFYTRGILRASSVSTPSTGNVSGRYIEVGNGEFSSSPWINGTGSRVFLMAVWDRALKPTEIASFERNPWQLLNNNFAQIRIKTTTTAYTLTFESGTYNLTGNAIGLTAQRRMSLDAGSYTLPGQNIGLTAQRRVAIDAGTYNLTGNDIALRFGYKMAIDSGLYSLTGNDIGFARTYVLQLQSGEYVITGQPIGLTYSGAEVAAVAGRSLSRRKRRALGIPELGNKDFTGKRNSRPGVAEEEMQEVLREVRAARGAMPIMVDDEDDDEEAILWLIR